MPSEDGGSVGVGELSRQVRDVFVRFEGLATRLETQFIRSDIFDMYKQLIDSRLKGLEATLKSLEAMLAGMARADKVLELETDIQRRASKGELESLSKRVSDLEDDKKWLWRLVLGFVVLGVLGAAFAATKVGG